MLWEYPFCLLGSNYGGELNLHATLYDESKHLYGTTISILRHIGENTVAIIHIYGARAIILLFCDHQDTESESKEIKTNIHT